MEETNNVQAENSNQAEEVVLETTNDEAEGEDTIETLQTKLAKAEEVARNQRIRAEKAESKAKAVVNTAQAPTDNANLSQIDLITIAKSNIHEDDITEVVEYAKFKKVSVSEALKSSYVKNLVSENNEKRQSAQISNSGASRRTASKVTGADLLERASKGEMPEDVQALAEARMEAKRKK